MSINYLIGIDIGTYSSKGVLVNTEGEVVASHSIPHSMDMPAEGFFEQDADKIWWHDFVEIVKYLLKTSGVSASDVIGVGVSAIGSCVLPIDVDGKPLRPGILYGIDTRASAEIASLENELGRSEIQKKYGSPLSSQASGPKVLWIKNHEPEVYTRTKYFLTSQAYIVYKLTREATIDVYTATGYAPLFDRENLSWDETTVPLIASIEQLPEIHWSHEVVGVVTQEAAKETGLNPGTPIVTGTTDASAEALSVGLSEPGDMMLMMGSSIFFILQHDQLVRSNHFWSSSFLEEGKAVIAGAMSTSGSLTTWFRNQFAQEEIASQENGGENAYAALAQFAEKSSPGSNGLILLPYFEGERTPLNDPDAKGLWFGLSLKHTKGDLYRSILEGVAFGIRNNLETMQSEGFFPTRIIAAGGGTKNPLWLQIIADVCNIEIEVPAQQIGASYGDAFLAGVGVGIYNNLSAIKEWVKPGRQIHPDIEIHKQYEINYQIFKELYSETKFSMKKMTQYLRADIKKRELNLNEDWSFPFCSRYL